MSTKMTPLECFRSKCVRYLNLAYDDRMAPDFVMALILANRLPWVTDPCWAYLVGPPSCGKNEGVRPWHGAPYTHFVSRMTAHAMLSGYKDDDTDVDPSLLAHIHNKTLVYMDLTATIRSGDAAVSEMLGIFRTTYGDEDQATASGTSGTRTYKSKYGVLFLCTPVVDTIMTRFQLLGERCLAYRMYRDSAAWSFSKRMAHQTHVLRMSAAKADWREDLRKTALACTEAAYTTGKEVGFVPPASPHASQIAAMGDAIARLRTQPGRDAPSDPEFGGRLAQQLTFLGQGRLLADGRTSWTYDDLQFLRRVAIDTLPRTVTTFLWALTPHDNSDEGPTLTSDQVARRTRLPRAAVLSLVEQYRYIGAIDPGNTESIRMSDDQVYELRKAGLLFGEEGLSTREPR